MARSYPSDLLTALRSNEQRVKLVVSIVGTSTTHRWCTGITPVRCDLDGDSTDEVYEPRAMRPGAVDLTEPGKLSTIDIDDTDGTIAAEMIAGGLTNRAITIGILVKDEESWLDPYVLVSGTVGELSIRDAIASLTIISNAGWRTMTGAAPCHMSCTLIFKGSRCNYSGSDTTCNRTWADCTSKSNTARFRGFRRLPSAGQLIRFAKVSVVLEQITGSGFPWVEDSDDSSGIRTPMHPELRAIPKRFPRARRLG